MSFALPAATPSDAQAQGVLTDLRYRNESGEAAIPVTGAIFVRRVMPTSGRIVGATGYLDTGGGGASTVDVLLNGATVLTAVVTFTGANAEAILGVLDTTHAAWDGTGIRFNSGDILTYHITLAQAGALNLNMEARLFF